MALRRVWRTSPNYSGRYGGAVRLIIVHTAEGALTHEALGNFFASSSAGVSSHTGIDDKAGECGEYVSPGWASWTAGDVNGYAIQTELCAFAAWDRAEWMRHPAMLENCRQWVAEEAARFGIPVVKSNSFGVCGHVDVSGPGGHWDPGPEFPWDVILGAPPTPIQEVHNMIARDEVTGGTWVAGRGGEVWAYDGARWLGSCNTEVFNAAHWPCVGIVPWGIGGYMLVLDTEVGDYNPDRFLRYRFPADGSGAAPG